MHAHILRAHVNVTSVTFNQARAFIYICHAIDLAMVNKIELRTCAYSKASNELN